MILHISREQARRLLAHYHFAQTDIAGVVDRLTTVQYDPLNPVGRNPDLVFQARVPGYQVDDWQKAAYADRLIYDAWDKQACLVPVSDWPKRALIREQYRPYHDREILQQEAAAVADILALIDAQGPLSSSEFADKEHMGGLHSWYGSTRTKRILRSLWACGVLVTHHRKNGRHYYARPEHVIPSSYFQAEPLLDEAEFHRWILTRRYRAMGLIPKTSDPSIWSGMGVAGQYKQAREELSEASIVTPVHVGEKAAPYYALTSILALLDAPLPAPRMIFLGPLDSLLWDRKSIRFMFDFDYIWEVYKPEIQRKWGYYILPVFYGDRFVARVDARLEKKTLVISHWWWESDIVPNAEMLAAQHDAIAQFLCYLRADAVSVPTASAIA